MQPINDYSQDTTQFLTPPPLFEPKRKKSGLRRFFLWTMVILLSFMGILVIIASFFNKQITVKALNAASSGLKTEVKISDAGLSLIRAFPDAAVNLKNVRMAGTFGGNLLEAEEVSLRFGLFSLFTDKIVIKKIVIRDGALAIRTDKKGRLNYDVLKSSDDKSENNLAIRLNNALFENMEIIYEDKIKRQEGKIHLDKAEFSGDFSEKEYDLESKAAFAVAHFDMEGERYFAGEKMKYDAILNINNQKNIYSFQRMVLNLGGNSFNILGTVVDNKNYTDMNIRLKSAEGDLSGLFKLLPNAYSSYFSDFKSEGKYSCDGRIKGRQTSTKRPDINFNFNLSQGSIFSEKLQAPLRSVSFDANLKMDTKGDGHLDIKQFKASFDGQPLQFNLKLDDFENPYVDFSCMGKIPMAAAFGLLDNDDITDGAGLMLLKNLRLKGRYSDMTTMSRIGQVDLAGQVEFDKAELVYKKEKLKFQSGGLELHDNVFTLKKLQLLLADSDFEMDGFAKNLLPVLFADSTNAKNAFLDFDANLTSNNVDIDQLMAVFTVKETEREVGSAQKLDSLKTAKNVGRSNFTDKLKGKFGANIKNFNFNKIEGADFHGALSFDHTHLLIDGDAKTMKGNVHFEGETFFYKAPIMKMRIIMKSIDLTECFRQCDNFDQDVITDKNIKGTLTGRLAAYLYWDETGEFQLPKMKLYADMLGHDGALESVKTFEDFSTFIHIEDLRNIQFSTLQNYIEISGDRLILPAMDIQNNAANMTISGRHTFDNEINYFVKINAGQSLLKRLKKHDGNLDPMPAGNGLFNLYYKIFGTLDKYDMVRSKRTVEKDFIRSEAKKREIIYILDKEFGANTAAVELGNPDVPGIEDPTAKPPTQTKPTTTGLNHGPPIVPDNIRVEEEELEFLDEIEGGGF